MSHLVSPPNIELASYQEFVARTRDPARYSEKNWRRQSADLLQGEMLEVLSEHGPGSTMLLRYDLNVSSIGYPIEDEPKLRLKMADELGDLLWFGNLVAVGLGKEAGNLCRRSLLKDCDPEKSVGSIVTFRDLQAEVVAHAPSIRVVNKAGLQPSNLPLDLIKPSIVDCPYYVFVRQIGRLARTLRGGHESLSPRGATELESLRDPETAVGDCLNAITYISAKILDVDIEKIARFNIKKLENRHLYGKENDVQLTEEDIL